MGPHLTSFLTPGVGPSPYNLLGQQQSNRQNAQKQAGCNTTHEWTSIDTQGPVSSIMS